MTKISRKLSLELLDAQTDKKVKTWIQKVEAEIGPLEWLPVGGLPNNSLACDLSSGAMPALIERITNAADAVIEDAMIYAGLTGEAPEPKSPMEAVCALFGVREKIDDTPASLLAEVASKVVVSLHDGTSPERPTTIIRDKGFGQHPDNFHSTLLSLCQDNKTDKPWLHGRYNAGSSASYKFAAATVVISRRNHEIEEAQKGSDAPNDEVGATVVLYVKGKRPGPCVYMADKDGKIIRLDLPEFEHGTEIRLVDYDIPKHSSKAAERTGSIRQAFFSHFVRPSLPFCISEHRAKFKDRAGNQKIYGLYHALDGNLSVEKSAGLAERPPICVHKQSHLIKLGGKVGAVTLRCFVLHEDAKKNYYVTPDQAFCFSLNGQRQYNKERSWYRDLGFNNIFQRIIAVVECDGIHYDERYNVFKSDREGIVHTELSEEIMDKVQDILRNDPDLQDLEEQAKEDKIKSAAGRVGENTLNEIKRIIGGYNVRGGGSSGIVTGRRTPPSGKKRNADDSHLPLLPTKLEIEKNPFNASRGSRLRLYVRLDAKNGYLPSAGRNIRIETGGTAEVISTSGLLGGSVRFDIKVRDDAPLGKHPFVVIFNDDANGIVLYDQAEMNVMEPKSREESEAKKDRRTGSADREVRVLWVRRDSWKEMGPDGWSENSVGECQEESDGSVTFFLNRDNIHLELAGDSGEFSKESWERFLERCSLAVTTGLYAIHKDKSPASDERIENEKMRMLQNALVSIKPELVQDAASVRRHAVPAVRETPGSRDFLKDIGDKDIGNPNLDVRSHGTYAAEMRAVMDRHRN